ncbi:MAG: sugar kinase [Clostridia bacterium]|nr:sugar kinase [Clostridia bacterium]
MKIVTFGEIMLRLAPIGYERFFQSSNMNATFGGAEANVAVSLANFGFDSCYVTKLPEGHIGDGAVSSLRYFGVDTSRIVRGGKRLGIYYMEKGASQRPSLCIYDRAGSSIAECSPVDFDWEEIFRDCCWFHFTGITPALSDGCAEALREALIIAKDNGITVSCDINYRSKLWSKAKASEVMTDLMQYVDVCISNEEDANDVFGIKAEDSDASKGVLSEEGYKVVASKLVQRFGLKYAAITLRSSRSANDNDWQALLYDGKDYYMSPRYSIHIVDRVGGGDSFGAGLIYGILSGKDPQAAIDFATAASCLKQTIEGDFNRVTVAEVEKLVKGDASGRVKR